MRNLIAYIRTVSLIALGFAMGYGYRGTPKEERDEKVLLILLFLIGLFLLFIFPGLYTLISRD